MDQDKLTDFARICHDANRAYCLTVGEDPATVYPSWDSGQLPEAIKESSRIGVQKALEGADPQALHESWCAAKHREGWVYGPTKDLDRKTHPCLMPYSQLPASQRQKDHLFIAIVSALSAGV